MPKQFATRAEADAYLAEIFKAFGITDAQAWQQFVTDSIRTDGGKIRLACDPAMAVPLAATSENFTKIDDINLTELWEKISIPTLILRGELSDVLDAPTVSAMRASNSAAQATVIAGVGHAPALNNAEQIGIVVNWLTRSSLLPAGL
jgi:pimeloyl-ACP methyl ester carboxylesterase